MRTAASNMDKKGQRNKKKADDQKWRENTADDSQEDSQEDRQEENLVVDDDGDETAVIQERFFENKEKKKENVINRKPQKKEIENENVSHDIKDPVHKVPKAKKADDQKADDQKWRENTADDSQEDSQEDRQEENLVVDDDGDETAVIQERFFENKEKKKENVINRKPQKKEIENENVSHDIKDPVHKVPKAKVSQKQASEPAPLYSILCYPVCGIAILIGVVLAFDCIPDESKPDFLYTSNTDDKFNYPKIFNDRLEQVHKLFPNQTDRFWKIIKVKGLAHLRNRKPSQPLVFMMGAPPAAHSAVNCIAKKIAWALDPEMDQENFIDGMTYSKREGDHAKKLLDDDLEDIFRRGVRSALVMHLERLPPPSPLLFYKYCDNDEAPFKHAGIIFTVHLPSEPDPTLRPVEAEGTIETYLARDAWSKYPYESDSISALLSRIADTVVLASHETKQVIQSACGLMDH